MISRAKVVQSLLQLFDEPTYLEIGVNRGETFLDVTASKKVGVDPKFLFDWRVKRSTVTTLHEVTSDAYFGTIVNADEQFDVIFLDGLHTFEQTLRDLINSLCHLKRNGIFVIDDILPNSYHAALPDVRIASAVREFVKGEADPSWMGDVYKLVFFIETFFQQFSFATIEDNHGQLVMWRQPRSRVVERSFADFVQLQFSSVVIGRTTFNIQTFSDILKSVRDATLR